MLKVIEEFIKKSLPYYNDVRVLDKSEYPKYGNYKFSLVMEGKVLLDGQSVTIQIALDDHFPFHKPFFFLKPYDVLGFIPHVDISGFICYIRDEGIIINTDNPLAIIEESFDRVIKTLTDGKRRLNHKDIQEEFVDYWNNLNDISFIESNVDLSSNVKVVKVAQFENYPRWFVGDNVKAILNYCYKYIRNTRMGKPTFTNALYIPLRDGAVLFPPSYKEFWTVKQFRNIIYKNITGSNKRILERLVKQKIKPDDVLIVLVSIPLSDGNRTLIGVKYSEFTPLDINKSRRKKEFSHPLYKTDANCKFSPLCVIRHDKDYLVPRGGGNNSLKDKKVALIGCGSVGGYIAVELAKAGIQKITLIDHECLMPENVYRHLLGTDSLLIESYKNGKETGLPYNPKIFGLKKEIERKLPYTDIDVLSNYIDRIENVISNNVIDFRQYDLVIVAIGNPTIELYLNEYFHKNNDMPPIIFTWVEAYGIGGHALLTNNNGKSGCLKCLYTDPFDEKVSLYNRASFAAEGQTFAKQVSGCSSMYIPYSSLDALQTAILATRLAIDTLTGKEKDNPILSWKGNADIFLQNGFKLSDRYSVPYEQLYNTRYLYKNKSCKICGHLEG